MKKNITIILSLFLIFSFSSCDIPGNKKVNTNKTEINQETKKQDVSDSEKQEKTETGNIEKTNSGTIENTNSGITENTQTGAIQEKEVKKQEVKKQEPKKISQKTMLIFDASGSMWGKINGKTKIEIAREVIKKTLNNFKEAELGLMAYGHRKKGDCKDIEILTNPAKNNGEKISNLVDKIVPKGMTPMGDSVLQAAESLKYTEQKATIILVSDGIETCGVDLCALGKKLEETGVDFTAHVIGFDMSEEQTAGLKCLAKETGGTFTSAKNAEDLGKALKKTVEASSCSKEKLGDVNLKAPKEINVGSQFEVEYDGKMNTNDTIYIVPKGQKDRKNYTDYSYVNSNGKVKLNSPIKKGEYDVVYYASCGVPLGRTSILVKDINVSISVPKEIPVGSEIDVKISGPKNNHDTIQLRKKGEKKYLDYIYANDDSNKDLIAPAESGEYYIVYLLGNKKEVARFDFKVIDKKVTISVPKEVLAGSKIDVKISGPKNINDMVKLMKQGETEYIDYIYAVDDNEKDFNAPVDAGNYYVVYLLGKTREVARFDFKVIDKKVTISVPKEVESETRVKIDITGPISPNDLIYIYKEGNSEYIDYIYLTANGENKINIPKEPGNYYLIYKLANKKEIARTNFKVVK